MVITHITVLYDSSVEGAVAAEPSVISLIMVKDLRHGAYTAVDTLLARRHGKRRAFDTGTVGLTEMITVGGTAGIEKLRVIEKQTMQAIRPSFQAPIGLLKVGKALTAIGIIEVFRHFSCLL